MKTFVTYFIFCWTVYYNPVICQDREINWLTEQELGSEVLLMTNAFSDGKFVYTAVSLFNQFNTTGLTKFRLIKINDEGVVEKDFILKEDAKGKPIFLTDLWYTNGELYGYYLGNSGESSIYYRDRIDKEKLQFTGEEVEVLKGHVVPDMDYFNPIWEKDERMDAYFDSHGNFQQTPDSKYHFIIKRETFKRNEAPTIQAVVLNEEMKIVNNVRADFSSTNTNLELFDAVVDDVAGLYLLTGDFENKEPVYTLFYYPPGNGQPTKTPIPSDVYIDKMTAGFIPGGLIITGLRSEDDKEKKLAHFVMHFDRNTGKMISDATLSDFSYDNEDKIFILSNGETYLTAAQYFTDSYVTTSSTGRAKLSPRYTFDTKVYTFSKADEKLWDAEIENYMAASGGGLMYDGIFPFILNDEYYIIHNTHPENPGLSAQGQKMKLATFGKDRFATELIHFAEGGKLDREFIYKREEKIVTIPTHSRHIGDGKFLMYGDKAGLGNMIQFGWLDLK